MPIKGQPFFCQLAFHSLTAIKVEHTMSSGDPSDIEEDAPAPQHDDGGDGIIVRLMQDVNIRKTTVPRGFSAVDGIMKIYACTRKIASNTWNNKLAKYPELKNHLSFIKFKGAGSKLISLHMFPCGSGNL